MHFDLALLSLQDSWNPNAYHIFLRQDWQFLVMSNCENPNSYYLSQNQFQKWAFHNFEMDIQFASKQPNGHFFGRKLMDSRYFGQMANRERTTDLRCPPERMTSYFVENWIYSFRSWNGERKDFIRPYQSKNPRKKASRCVCGHHYAALPSFAKNCPKMLQWAR